MFLRSSLRSFTDTGVPDILLQVEGMEVFEIEGLTIDRVKRAVDRACEKGNGMAVVQSET